MTLEATERSPWKAAGGLAGWLLDRLRRNTRPRPRLALVERIALAPRQSLALVEADGRRVLVATSPEGAPAFYPLDRPPARTSDEPASQAPRSFVRPLRRPASRTVRARMARASW
jgi:flagellar biogenesis protein FliO